MYCNQCGKEINKEMRFCPFCGAEQKRRMLVSPTFLKKKKLKKKHKEKARKEKQRLINQTRNKIVQKNLVK
ncbi:zinc-ribbon domain-containing protein [Tetragenococcus koreensis]|uniref:zinc-ribbon domain-containing protein n=1 Tax=Tetragenococcus koreensis TaxID=290335 RepID=UPI000F4F2134|nr:zinc ribbon domain-containing protein [Tetragenococcus koreensis]AYW46475.1 hypothetical protein C7K43_11400 [Tetragenococcus koreensis]GEN92239.1 hypothetical protein TKO01_22850 [Tetragenococcus koreensis]